MSVKALYIHIPFCHARCTYCDFDTKAACGARLDAQAREYVELLTARLSRAASLGVLDNVETVYIGGGTPTVLGERLLDIVRQVKAVCDPVEFTCEANPESFTSDLAASLYSAGVTRISLGVQSLDNSELSLLGRIHSSDDAERAVRLARSVGFTTSMDLICGLPAQSMESWTATLERACALETDHISVYPLMVEEGTPLFRSIEADEVGEPDDDLQAAMMDRARSVLVSRGFEPYEVASYSRDGNECLHNIAYWTGKSYLGIGRSAASMLSVEDFIACQELFDLTEVGQGASRVRIVQVDDGATRFECEQLSLREACAEDLMLAVRMTRGISFELLRKSAACIPVRSLSTALHAAVDQGLLRLSASVGSIEEGLRNPRSLQGSFAAPTQRGWLLGNLLYGLMWDLHED